MTTDSTLTDNTKQTPSLIEGGNSCSLKGSIMCTYGIRGALPLLHAGPGCSVCASYGHNMHAGDTYPFANTAMCSQEVIFGGEGSLKKGIRAASQVFDPELMVVTTGCQASTIGDDVAAVIEEVKSEGIACEILNSGTGGYDGDLYFGFRKTGLAILKQLAKTAPVRKNIVNVIGFPAHIDIYWKGDMAEIRSLLSLLGLEINCIFPGEATVAQIQAIPSARLNLVVDEQMGREMAEYLKETYGTPFVVPRFGSLIGTDNTMEFFSEIVDQLGLSANKLTLLEQRKKKALQMAAQNHYLWAEVIQNAFSTFAISTHASMALGLTRFLMTELGMQPLLINMNPSFPGSREKLERLLKLDGRDFEPIVLEDTDNFGVCVAMGENWPRIFMGRGTANIKGMATMKGTVAYLALAYPALDRFMIYNRPMMGFNGVPSLFDDTVNRVSAFF